MAEVDSQPVRRSHLHRIYYVLAAFDLVTVTLGLWLIASIVGNYSESVAMNRIWAERTASYTELSRQAALVNAPGNDLFQSNDPQREEERHAEALMQFQKMEAEIRIDLEQRVPDEHRAALMHGLDLASRAMDEMNAETSELFRTFRLGQSVHAGRHMALMDQAHDRVGAALAELTREVQSIQEEHFTEEQAHTERLRRFEFLIAGLIIVMVGAVTIYGHKLSVRMRESAEETQRSLAALSASERELARHQRHLEELVAQRTRALEQSHEQLRGAERYASIGTLAAGLGHDMNNVLFPVRCRVDAMRAQEDLVSAFGDLDAIRQSIDYLQQLSDGLRLMALDPDDPESASGVTKLRSWWDEVRPLFLSALPRLATLEGDIPDDLPPIALPPHRLTQAVFNLVVNAGEAIDEQGVVRVWARPGERGNIRVGVTDTGMGMTDEVRRQAFDPFFTTKKRGLSTGLGLALVQGVVRSAKGSIEIDTEPGRGTTIVMAVPAVFEAGTVVPDHRTACVSVTDRRLATFVAALLRTAGYDVQVTPGKPPPDDTDVWVTNAVDENLVLARALAADGRARVIAINGSVGVDDGSRGGDIASWGAFARVLDASAGMGGIQSAIRETLARAVEAGDDQSETKG